MNLEIKNKYPQIFQIYQIAKNIIHRLKVLSSLGYWDHHHLIHHKF